MLILMLRLCLLMLERQRSWKIVEALETHREERQMEENSLHNQHNIVNFLLEVSRAHCAGHATKLFENPISACKAGRLPAQSDSSRCYKVKFGLHSILEF